MARLTRTTPEPQAVAPPSTPATSASWRLDLSPPRALLLPLAVAILLLGGTLAAADRGRLAWTFAAAAGVLLAWTAALLVSALRSRRVLTLEIALRKQHYIQACAQGSVLLYWGWYWPEVQAWAPFIAAQLVFAYGIDSLLSWSRRDQYTLGFGPFPVIFSINLFLWFKQEWFFLQLAMVALGFLGKELIQWRRDGRRTHVFNPSAFTLAVFSIGLLLTGTTSATWGPEIAITQFYPPHIYLLLFLVSLPGQFFFGVASMTMSAVATTYVFGLLYFAATGVYFFYDSYIPIAVFLGMHLLFTDPSTSPRTELGRIIFGMLYGLSTVVLYVILGRAGLPTFYDKLLQVPFMNLSIVLIDRAVRSPWLRGLDPAALGRALAPSQRHVAYMSVWIIVFAAISAAEGVGDRHPGQWLPFWQQACAAGRPHACEFLSARQETHCEEGSGWACNEVAYRRLRAAPGSASDVQPASVTAGATALFERGCKLGFAPACRNLLRALNGGAPPEAGPPTLADYPIVLRGSKQALIDPTPAALYGLACDQGWPGTCGAEATETTEATGSPLRNGKTE